MLWHSMLSVAMLRRVVHGTRLQNCASASASRSFSSNVMVTDFGSLIWMPDVVIRLLFVQGLLLFVPTTQWRLVMCRFQQ